MDVLKYEKRAFLTVADQAKDLVQAVLEFVLEDEQQRPGNYHRQKFQNRVFWMPQARKQQKVLFLQQFFKFIFDVFDLTQHIFILFIELLLRALDVVHKQPKCQRQYLFQNH